jgi:hypothetical protein
MKSIKAHAAWRATLAALLVAAMSQPARADVIADIGAELFSWTTTFDSSLFPWLVSIGLLITLGTWFINKMAAVGLFTGVVIGALMYGLRDPIVALGS